MKWSKKRDFRKIPVRFNYYFDGEGRKVTLKPGESVSFSFRRETDEGFRGESVTLSLENRVIVERYLSEGRDCDGRYQQAGERRCPVYDRAAIRPHRQPGSPKCRMSYPRFQVVEDEVYDEYAEMDGY